MEEWEGSDAGPGEDVAVARGGGSMPREELQAQDSLTASTVLASVLLVLLPLPVAVLLLSPWDGSDFMSRGPRRLPRGHENNHLGLGKSGVDERPPSTPKRQRHDDTEVQGERKVNDN
jgi:hypothetical protein